MSITLFGTEEQKQKYLPKMATGEWIGAHALSEIGSGSDVFNMATTAKKVDGGYILNGEKRLVTLAPICNVAIAFANSKPELGKWGITAFIVDKTMKGFTSQASHTRWDLERYP
jgi:alkylation response protein AidB-like acyl-CoA dehydrogenase